MLAGVARLNLGMDGAQYLGDALSSGAGQHHDRLLGRALELLELFLQLILRNRIRLVQANDLRLVDQPAAIGLELLADQSIGAGDILLDRKSVV